MKNIIAAICVIALSVTIVSCREQEEMITSADAQSLKILEQATDDNNTTYVAPAIDSDGEPPIPPPKR